MIKKYFLILLSLLLLSLSPSLYAADTNTDTSVFSIGYLELASDPRYGEKQLFARYLGKALGRPYAGAEVALKEVKYHGAALGLRFELERRSAKDADDLMKQVEALQQMGVRFILTDLPAADLAPLAKAMREQDVVFINVSAPDDSLRQADCQANLYHTLPNEAMQTDAIAQLLVSRKWNKVLLLIGTEIADQRYAEAFIRSAKRYGVKILESKPFVLSNDPRERDQNNIALLTGGNDYDAIFVADTKGEFARNVPYHTLRPNIIIGSEGLTASAWHWSWERNGAPQLEKRFEKMHQRPMTSVDWAAWMAVKAIAEAVQSKKSAEMSRITDYFTTEKTGMDNFKGIVSSFRTWDHQLRQPLLLHTHNWIVERAPIKGFLHQKNNLDTLGFDQRDSQCQFAKTN